ncbi:TetR/AcrR family transcriptional regulator [Novosphingobium pentaromativorans]|uniref:HTH tetR-type domain-containing protein n=1 Tax=Novosphingobium pentaromativorans US6-1 TaxID=1088721 RepID=G6EGV0_9SPHN|nr:TetR/AcrR family transcriptional regulator [Novosphingobium pentaromativorans]EHJ59239.1 hypothetical protein NSU_3571 [Novosphingobium pentaromativorans US6-1]
MRTKTVERRQAIVEAASEVFQEFGYARASMSLISARVGGSKSTIYNYFASKEELFAAVTSEIIVDGAVKCADRLLKSKLDAPLALSEFAEGFLKVLTTDRSVAIMRAGISGSFETSSLTAIYHENARKTWDLVGQFLEKLQTDGQLRDVDLDTMVAHFKGLIEAGIFEPLLSGDTPWLDPSHSAGAAVDAFLRAYGTKAFPDHRTDKARAAK